MFSHSEFEPHTYHTAGGIQVLRTTEQLSLKDPVERLIDDLDSCRGVLLASYYEYPGR